MIPPNQVKPSRTIIYLQMFPTVIIETKATIGSKHFKMIDMSSVLANFKLIGMFIK